MKLDHEIGALTLTPNELAALIQDLGVNRNQLSLLPREEEQLADDQAILEPFFKMKKEDQQLFTEAIHVLAAPLQVAKLHYSIGSQAISRLMLSWPNNSSVIASLSNVKGGYVLKSGASDDLKQMINTVLGVESKIFNCNIRMEFTAQATIVLLAVMEYFRFAWYQSMLMHAQPSITFTEQDLLTRLAETEVEDFRWPLAFFAKITPADLLTQIDEDPLRESLQELIGAELIVKNDEEESSVAVLYTLTEKGHFICDRVLQDISKVALVVCGLSDNGDISYDASLLLRDDLYLWLFNISGNEGAVMNIDGETLEKLLQLLLMPFAVDQDSKPAEIKQSDPFKATSERFVLLKADLEAGKLSAESFRSALEDLRFQDTDGAWWQIAEEGRWLKWDGNQWVNFSA
jgi:hypothetical protein